MKSSLQTVIATFSRVLSVTVDGTTRIGDDIEIDSVDILEVVNGLETEYGVKVEDSDLYQIETVADLADLFDAVRAD